jgi:transcriptional regulator GlxA family with amidase domain
VSEAWRLLTERPDLGVDDVAREVGFSRRRLGQLISGEVGRAPKTVQRLARFDAARRAVAATPLSGMSLAVVASRAGYYDQSHLVRGFHEFAGLGPSAWLAEEFPNLQGVVPVRLEASRP